MEGEKYGSCDEAKDAFVAADATSVKAASKGDIDGMKAAGVKSVKDLLANKSCYPDSVVKGAEQSLAAEDDEFDIPEEGIPEECIPAMRDAFALVSAAAGRYDSGDEKNAAQMAKGFEAIKDKSPRCLDDETVQLLNYGYKNAPRK